MKLNEMRNSAAATYSSQLGRVSRNNQSSYKSRKDSRTDTSLRDELEPVGSLNQTASKWTQNKKQVQMNDSQDIFMNIISHPYLDKGIRSSIKQKRGPPVQLNKSPSTNNYMTSTGENQSRNQNSQSVVENQRIKMLKRFTLKSKAANVLQRIGFPQKKFKIQEELRKIKKEIGSKMDDDNTEFFDLLNQTQQSFYNTLNDSIGVQIDMNQTMNEDQFEAYKNMRGDSRDMKNQRPMTQAKNRLSVANKQLLMGIRDSVSLRDRNSRNTAIGDQRSVGHNTNLNNTIRNIQTRAMERNRPVTTEKQNAILNKIRNNTSNHGRLTADSTKFTIQTTASASRPGIAQRTIKSNGLKDRGDSIDSEIIFNTVTEKSYLNKKSAYQSQTEIVEFEGRKRSNSKDKKEDFFDQKRSTSRLSFKKSRFDIQLSSVLQQCEKYFEATKHVMSENMAQLKRHIYHAYDVAVFPSYTLDERKTSLLEIWSNIVELVKQSSDLNSFEMVFMSQKVLGDIYLDFKDLTEAIRVYKSLKILCEDFQKYKEKMHIYEQIGYTYRLMKDNENAVKQFKKMLQLAWQEGDTVNEVTAYDNLSVDYFYLGEISKSNYYHDRIMRGKTENNRSIVKKVSTNLLISRREHRHNIELRKMGDKQKGEFQRLPSPSAISKGTQFSKAINLLPNYTEAQAKGIQEEDDDQYSSNNLNKPNTSKSAHRPLGKCKLSQGPNFTQKELVHLNKPPNYDYLKQPKKEVDQYKVKSMANRANSVKEQPGVFKQSEPVDYHPFDEDRFRDIVAYAIQKKETSHTTDDKRNISHMSVHRTAPLNQLIPVKLMESLRKLIEQYTVRVIQLANTEKTIQLIRQQSSSYQ